MDDLIRKLTQDLGVSRRQAEGGLVALLRAGRQHLSKPDYAQFLAEVPGADELLRSAPAPSALSSVAGGLGSLLGGRSAAGRWAGLAAAFAELGIAPDTAKKFGPIVIEHVRQHGGEALVGRIRSALKL